MNGKISRLPHTIREQLNRRLADAEPHGLAQCTPRGQRIIAGQFQGRPISKQNLYEWTQYGFRNWKMRQADETLTPPPSYDRGKT